MAGLMAEAYRPLDVACPRCRAHPGLRCRSVVITSQPLLRRPHAERVLAARTAAEARSRDRAGTATTDAWTCPDCGRSYWPPKEWEPELWPAVRTQAQLIHNRRHAAENGST
jgi:hypothetical protein